MTSKVQAWNMALARVRSTANVQDEAENSAEARYCALYHDNVLRWLLEEGNWPFARKRTALAETGTPPDEWQYQYAYPVDCLHIIEILQSNRMAEPLAFQESLDEADNKIILCDVQAAKIHYIKNITDFSLLNETAVNAFVEMLASYISVPLAKDENMEMMFKNSAIQMLHHAKAKNANRDRADKTEESSFTRFRNDQSSFVR
jgi:hypothetical protein